MNLGLGKRYNPLSLSLVVILVFAYFPSQLVGVADWRQCLCE